MASVNDGSGAVTQLEIQRRDLFKVAGFVLALVVPIVGGIVGLSMYIFQTRSAAIAEHAEIDKRAALAAQRAELQREFDEREADAVMTDVEDTKKIVLTLDTNQRTLMQVIGTPRRRIEPLPVGVSFEEMGIEDPEE